METNYLTSISLCELLCIWIYHSVACDTLYTLVCLFTEHNRIISASRATMFHWTLMKHLPQHCDAHSTKMISKSLHYIRKPFVYRNQKNNVHWIAAVTSYSHNIDNLLNRITFQPFMWMVRWLKFDVCSFLFSSSLYEYNRIESNTTAVNSIDCADELFE